MGSWMAKPETIRKAIEATMSRANSKIHAREFAIESGRDDSAKSLAADLAEEGRLLRILERSLKQATQRGV